MKLKRNYQYIFCFRSETPAKDDDATKQTDLSSAKSFLTMRQLLPPQNWVRTAPTSKQQKSWREANVGESGEYYDEDDYDYYDYGSSSPTMRLPPDHLQAPLFPHRQRAPPPPLPPAVLPRTVRLHPITRQLHHNLEQMRKNKRRRYLDAFIPSPQDPYWRGQLGSGMRKRKKKGTLSRYIRPEEIVDHYKTVFKQQMDDEGEVKPPIKRPRLLRMPVTPRSRPPTTAAVIPSSLRVRERPAQPPNWDFLHTNVQEYFHQRPNKKRPAAVARPRPKSRPTPPPHSSRLYDASPHPHYHSPPNRLAPHPEYADDDEYRANPIDPDDVSPYFRDGGGEQGGNDEDLFPRLFGEHNSHQDHRDAFPDISDNNHLDGGIIDADGGNPLDLQPFHDDGYGHRDHLRDPGEGGGGGIHQPDLTTTTTTGPRRRRPTSARCRHQSHESLFPSFDRKDNLGGQHAATSTTVGPKGVGAEGVQAGFEAALPQVNKYKKYGASLSLDPVNAFEISSYNKGWTCKHKKYRTRTRCYL